jgi:hypothetical protein
MRDDWMKSMEVEYLVAFTDKTWDTVTEVVEVPEDLVGDELSGYLEQAGIGLLLNPQAPRFEQGSVATIAVYHVNEDYEREEDQQ